MSSPTKHSAKDVGDFYNEQTSNFLKVYGQVIQAFRTKNVTDLLKYQIESIGLEDGMKVLDAGCGVCGPARYFATQKDLKIDAVTISQKQVELSSTYLKTEGLADGISVHLGDYHQLGSQFANDHYDVVYFLESFGHATNHKQVIEEAWKVLKPGGILYIKDLFIKIGFNEQHDQQIQKEIENINSAYRYNVADLNETLTTLRKTGFILSSLKTVDLPLELFENLTISNDFQELTGINKIDSLSQYIFPIDFFELKCIKPWNRLETGNNRYFLQNHYYIKVHGKKEEDL